MVPGWCRARHEIAGTGTALPRQSPGGVSTGHGPVLALEDVIDVKVQALVERGAVRDLICVHAA
ncbi:hypothetical protein ACH47Z_46655 [Streptomyces sp. NPDC020192]|uniref:hypothetical protein n=1 Tax=Streptomyces sp. NPDC020192 TaxID=3365066 RepID=UPI00379DE481